MQIFAKTITLISAAFAVAIAFGLALALAAPAAVHADSPEGEAKRPLFVDRAEIDIRDYGPESELWAGIADFDIHSAVQARVRMRNHWDLGYGCDARVDRLPGRGVFGSGVFDFAVRMWTYTIENEDSVRLEYSEWIASGRYDHEIRFRIENTPDKSRTWLRLLDSHGDLAYGRIRDGRDIDEAFSSYGLAKVLIDCERRIQGVFLGMSLEPWAGSDAYFGIAPSEREIRKARERAEERSRIARINAEMFADARARWLAAQ